MLNRKTGEFDWLLGKMKDRLTLILTLSGLVVAHHIQPVQITSLLISLSDIQIEIRTYFSYFHALHEPLILLLLLLFIFVTPAENHFHSPCGSSRYSISIEAVVVFFIRTSTSTLNELCLIIRFIFIDATRMRNTIAWKHIQYDFMCDSIEPIYH